MTIKGTKVIGLKVITRDKGEQIDTVDDILYSSVDHRVHGLLVNSGGLFGEAKVIPIEDVNSIGENAIIVDSKENLHHAKELPETLSRLAKSDNYLTETKIVTETGDELGTISDLNFNEETGEVESFEVSQGALKNVGTGIKTILPQDIITVGKDATIVRASVKDKVAAQAESGGLRGTISNVRDKAKAESSQFAHSIRQKSESPQTKSKINEAQQRINTTNQELTHQVEDVLQSERTQKVKTAAKGAFHRAKEAVDQALDDASAWGKQQTAEVKGGKKVATQPKKADIPPNTPITITDEEVKE
jgi:uncharacterized protein YrrD